MYNFEQDLKILVKNGWIEENEVQKYLDNKDIVHAINVSTSPSKENIFNALKRVSTKDIKVLILGQDPYPNPAHAHGLAFSSLDSKTPASLRNVFIALDGVYDSNLYENKKNDLTKWTDSGVLLLNTWLTYEDAKLRNKHKKIWSEFINSILKKILSIKNRPIVMMLWGQKAQDRVFDDIEDEKFLSLRYDRGINILPGTKIMILQSGHPSPTGVNTGASDFMKVAPIHFKECDNHLKSNKIHWTDL